MEELYNLQESKAPFNMAISTLEALRKILSHIEYVYLTPLINDEVKQSIKVNLVKRFYVDCSPLLPADVVEKYKEILKLRPVAFKVINSADLKLTGSMKVVFDWDLEEKMDNYLISLQTELQKEKYFMPPKKDLGRAIAEF
jgi:hypothetical protein